MRLLRTAIVLAGSRDADEDLLQAALERLFRNWRKIRGDPEGYLRHTLAHLAADGWRRRGRSLGGTWQKPGKTGPMSPQRGRAL